MDQRSDVMRVVLKGSGPEPLLVLLVHSGGHELELDHGPLRRPSDHAALVLLQHFNSISDRLAASTLRSFQGQTDEVTDL